LRNVKEVCEAVIDWQLSLSDRFHQLR
jgi:hypothetical protein